MSTLASAAQTGSEKVTGLLQRATGRKDRDQEVSHTKEAPEAIDEGWVSENESDIEDGWDVFPNSTRNVPEAKLSPPKERETYVDTVQEMVAQGVSQAKRNLFRP